MKYLFLIFLCCFSTRLWSQSNNSPKAIHIFVALCDNKYQGIAPVPESIGNGQQASTNLYWGAGYGLKTFFNRSKDWQLLKTYSQVDSLILERLIFKHKSSNTYLLADAYDGRYIQQTLTDFVEAAAGRNGFELTVNKNMLCFGGDANLIGYVGHNGLMEVEITGAFEALPDNRTDAIVLACYGKQYFDQLFVQTNARPLLWTTHLMAPEAYTLEAALSAWIKESTPDQVAEAAAQAYNKYQKCGIGAARKLLVTG
ncbi:hypothetical protein [Nonlabens xiamenensis]|uniref:hypothetical protein n=1 Tax=Nonlabens xiamenensis TaxID=2341043 RepID=UPI000F607EC2|nr:hypothetical protein [Nonlabens xiamenensis]